jgi:hypothetical protein
VAACRCLKQDIPEVEAVIAALVPRLEEWWVEAIEDILRRGDLMLGVESILANPLTDIEALAGNTPDGRSRIDIERELERLLVRQLRDAVTSFAPVLAAEVEEARDSLLADAALALGLSLTTEQLGAIEARLGPLRAGAVRDLETLMVGRIDTRTPQVREAVASLVRGSVRPRAGLGREEASAVVQTLRGELKAILGAASPRQWVPFVADQWSYRWFNIGQYVTARDNGLTLIRAMNNPPRGPDAKTTAFCRWVHGRVIDVGRADDQIREHVRASLAGDIGRLMSNWPLLSSQIAEDDSETAEASFALNFRRLGLPPYHARCRTVPVAFRRPR